MRVRARALFKDRRGISSTAIAALFSIAVVLIFMTYINDLGNDQKLFITIMGFFKAIGVLPEDFDPWEILNSPVGPLAAYIGAYMCMLFAVIGTFVFIKWPLQAASEISSWRRKRREKERKIRDEEAKRMMKLRAEELERGLELDTLSILGPSEQLSFAHRLRQYYAEHPPSIERYTGGERHIRAEKVGKEFLIQLGEKDIQRQIHHYGIDIRDNRSFERIPDYTSERYIMECKTGRDRDFERMWEQAWQDISIKEQEGKDIIWFILEHPVWYYIEHPYNTWKWRKIINLLESHGAIVRYRGG